MYGTCGWKKERSMNMGQNRGIDCLTQAWLALCACVCFVALSGLAAAAPEVPQPTAQPERSWENYYGVAILPTGRAVVVGDKGVVMITDNQGRTWTRRQLKKGIKYYDLYSVAFAADGSTGWVVGDNGVIFRTNDRGATWNEQKAPAGAGGALMKVAVADAQKACASGEHGVIVCTSDGGANWSLQNFGDIGLFDLAFMDADNGWAVGEFQTMLHTSDGGKSWKVQTGGDRMKNSDPYFAIAFGGGHDGLAVGLTGSALETSDGGKTWKPANLSIEHNSYYAVTALPPRAGAFYLAGENGVTAQLAGGQLSQVPSGSKNAISAVAFSGRYAMAVGLSGTLLRSDDGGQHWHSLTNQEQALTNPAQ
jgi:photosystem II stability/assembly factor-like uncharacterized protein